MDPTHNYNSSCIFVFSLWTVIVTICTYVLLCTYGLCYFAFTDCVIIIAAALFALHCYSAIFIAARVQNKLIHSYFLPSAVTFHLESWTIRYQGWKKSWFLIKNRKNQIILFKSIFFYLNQIFWFFFNFLHFSVLLCIVVALNTLNCIVSCTLHRIKVPEPLTIN